MRLAIADPPYPPMFAERRDRPDGSVRVTSYSRARRYYGAGTRPSYERPADFHPDAGEWLVAPARSTGFPGRKPPEWTRWVLDALGYQPEVDSLVDLFPGSGAVAAAASQGVLL